MIFLFALLFALSGFAFLSAEVVFIREMGLRTGSTPLSASWILMTYFLFAALGSKLGGKLAGAAKASAQRYGWAELGVAAALAIIYAIRKPVFENVFLGQFWEYAYALFLFAIPSLLSGMTLPLLGAAFAPEDAAARSRRAGFLYACNLAGAAIGIPVGGVYLPWKFGYANTVWMLASMLALIGIAAVIASRIVQAPKLTIKSEPKETPEENPRLARWAAWVMIASGALTLATEIVVIGYFQIISEESIYSYSAVLLIFLLGLSLGTGVAALFRPPLAWTLVATTILLLLTPIWLEMAFFGRHALFVENELTHYARLTTVAGVILLPLLAAQGAVFPLAWSLLRKHQAPGPALGHFLLLNKIGSAIGVLIAGYYFIHWLGFETAFYFIAGLYMALALVGFRAQGVGWPKLAVTFAGTMVVALSSSLLTSGEPIDLEDGETLLGAYHGRSDLVTVVEDAGGSRHIRVNQAYTLNGTQRALDTQRMEGWLPCVLSPAQQRVLFIGMASGISATAVLDFPVKELAAVELSPEVVRASREHFSEWNAPLSEDSRAEIIIDDGRHVLAQSKQWDLIIGDLFNPVRAGASQLYSWDYFELARERLSPQGQCWSWIPPYQFDETMLAATLRAFSESFEHAIVVRANFDSRQPVIALVGSPSPIDFSPAFLAARLQALPDKVRAADPLFLRSVANLQLTFIGDLHAANIQKYLAGFPANTDDAPLLAFLGPRNFGPGELLRGIKLLDWGGNRFSNLPTPSISNPSESLANAQRAANHFYAAGIMSIMLPGAPEADNAQRRQRANYHWSNARSLAPDVEISPDETRK